MDWRRHVRRWAPLLAFLFVTLAAGYAIQQSAERDAQLLFEGLMRSCERQNLRDHASNKRSSVIEEVLFAAADSREREASVAGSPEARKVHLEIAERYRVLASGIPFIDPVDCEEVVPRP